MKTKIFITIFFLTSLFLTGCAKTDKTPGAVPAQPAPTDEATARKDQFEGMTEEERVQKMIQMIEAKEAEMKTDKTGEGTGTEANQPVEGTGATK
jgi:hypothetical protein